MMTSADASGTALAGQFRLEPVRFSDISGLPNDDLASALACFRRQAREILDTAAGFARLVLFGAHRSDWLAVCEDALVTSDPHVFFTTRFRPYRVYESERPAGLFTGYYEPEAEGSLVRTAEFQVPLYRKPDDLVPFSEAEEAATGLKYGLRQGGVALPYPERRAIEEGALAGRGLEICWLRSWEEAFFMQVQGSGRVRLPNGTALRLSYAAKSGLPYTSIGGLLVERGTISRAEMSMQSLKVWMNNHPTEARQLMWQNKSFVFFRALSSADTTLGAIGAGRVPLTPHRSLAVDRSNWMFGTPMWIETTYPPEAERSNPDFRQLMIAQDTGSAIRGFVRGDTYWGWGEEAAVIAGHMKSPGCMTVLLPHAVCARLELPT